MAAKRSDVHHQGKIARESIGGGPSIKRAVCSSTWRLSPTGTIALFTFTNANCRMYEKSGLKGRLARMGLLCGAGRPRPAFRFQQVVRRRRRKPAGEDSRPTN